MERWVGKVAVVTGASSGIGEAIARVLTNLGLHVIGLARRENRLEKLSTELSNLKGFFHGIRCDVSCENDIKKAFKYVEENFGGVDILINNSAILVFKYITDNSIKDLRSVMDINFMGAVLCSREAIKSMRKRGTEGHIININSVEGLNASYTKFPVGLYAASKYALRAMTQNLRTEFSSKEENIRIASIYPGLVRTEIVQAAGQDEGFLDIIPSLEAKDIADCVVFILSVPTKVQIEDMTVGPLNSNL